MLNCIVITIDDAATVTAAGATIAAAAASATVTATAITAATVTAAVRPGNFGGRHQRIYDIRELC